MGASMSPDGSPVEVYLAIPPGRDLEILSPCIPLGASILDLGSGPGRISNPLARAGHEVVAVDEFQPMLDHVRGAVTVCADIWKLDLGRRFDVVLAMSHLVNDRSDERRVGLLQVCRRHLAAGGMVVVQRLPPEWRVAEGEGTIGAVGIHLHDVESLPGGFKASTTYRVGSRTWTQHWEASLVDDDELERCAAAADLAVERLLDDERCWVVLRERSRSGSRPPIRR
ncbi:MAG: class I SAM-dependent methyltransferase [Acidimicrobiia bacterium]